MKASQQNGRNCSKRFEEGNIYEGCVTGHNEKKTVAYLLVNDKYRASVYFKNVLFTKAEFGRVDKALPLDTVINVKYIGKDKEGHDQWQAVEIKA